MKKLVLYSITLISLFSNSCSNEVLDQEKLVLSKNNELNNAFASKNWKLIHDFKENANEVGIGIRPDEVGRFIRTYDRGYGLHSLTIQTISYKFYGDTVETKNFKRMVLIPNPNKIFDDTVYHYWVIKGDEFFLKDWDVYKHPTNYVPGDSLLRQKLDKIRDSLHQKLIDDNKQ